LTTLTLLDGAKSIGGNKILLQTGKRSYLLDFGINYQRMGKFYEEYLRPRSTRGLHDYLEMGLVPQLNIYREDIIPSDLDLGRLRDVKIDGIFLTHAHLDHAGCIGLLDLSIPIICTPTTAIILRAMEDSGRAELPQQVAYVTPKEPLANETRVVKSREWKIHPYLGRKFLLTSKVSDSFREFWSKPAGRRELLAEPPAEASPEELGFKWWDVDHSIYGASAYAFEIEEGWVVYTGDLRTHGKRGDETKRFVREASELNVAALLIEGTRVEGEGAGEESEEEVYENCSAVIERERGLVIADFQPRHFERLETFLRIARETKRSLIITARDAYMLEAVKLADGIDRARDTLVYYELKEKRDRWETGVLERFASRMIDPTEISKNPGTYILCFSFWDMKNLLDIKPKGGTYVYSSSEAFTEEAEFNFFRLWEWLQHFKLNVVGFEISGFGDWAKPEFHRGYHASGHASGEELLQMIEQINPKIVVPLHTERPEYFAERVRSCKTVLLENGQRLEL
jgi:ribonuclease J